MRMVKIQMPFVPDKIPSRFHCIVCEHEWGYEFSGKAPLLLWMCAECISRFVEAKKLSGRLIFKDFRKLKKAKKKKQKKRK